MSDKNENGLREALGAVVFTALIAVLTLPILHALGIHDALVSLSAECTNMLFKALGIPL